MKITIFFLSIVSLLVFTKCYYDSDEQINYDLSSGCDPTNTTYTTCAKPIIDNNCKGCHSGNGASAGIKLDTYANAKTNFAVSLTAIKNGTMPPSGKLAQSDITTLENWQTQGFKE